MYCRKSGKVRSAVAVVAVALMLWTPAAPLLAQGQAHGDTKAPTHTIQGIDALMPGVDWPDLRSTFERLSRTRRRSAEASAMSIPATISKGEFLKQLPALREFAASLASDKDPRMARRGNAMSLWLDIASAQTHQERHARIRQLPVTVRTSQASEDGRVVKEFVMEGKTRLQVSFAVAPSHSALSGPSISDDCYGGEPEPCSTQEDMDDLFVLLADSNNELSSGQADLDQEWAEYDDYCSNNPWDCDGNHLEVMPSGPSAAECDASGGCVGDAVAATAQGLAAGLEIVDGYVAAQGAVAEGVMLSIGEAAAIADGITIAVGVFGFFAYNFIQCKRAKVRAPLEFVQDRASLRNLAWSPVTSGAEL